MEDWIAKAINSAKDHIQKDAAVANDRLSCNRWIASSALQKAIRRGDTAIALRAAFALHREDRSATWRRLIAIAFEDVGPADLDVVLETVAVATLPKWRVVIGEEAVLRSIIATLASAYLYKQQGWAWREQQRTHDAAVASAERKRARDAVA